MTCWQKLIVLHPSLTTCLQDYDVDELIDVIEGSRVYIPCIYAVNKIDQASPGCAATWTGHPSDLGHQTCKAWSSGRLNRGEGQDSSFASRPARLVAPRGSAALCLLHPAAPACANAKPAVAPADHD